MPAYKNLTVKRFGHLTVLSGTEERENGYCMWQCVCDCGREMIVSTKKLQRGTVTDCGCIPKKTARNGAIAEDLEGRQFGYLTALRRAENRKGRMQWVCRCRCGREKTVSAHDLKSGKVRSCGCKAHDHAYNRIDISGRRLGRMTAMYPTDKRDQRGSVYWHCRCDCGNETDITEACLMHGNYQSCGCLKAENQQRIAEKLHRIDGTCVEILEKRKYRRDNTSGFRGVHQMKNERYRVDIGFKRNRFYLGTYAELQEAIEVRMEAEKKIHNGFLEAYKEWDKRTSEDPEWGKKNPFIFEVEKKDGNIVITRKQKLQKVELIEKK